MKKFFFGTLPEWVMYDQFWHTLKKRNLWLIHLRYAAAATLAALAIVDGFLDIIELEVVLVGIVAVAILMYNIVFHRMHKGIPEGYATFNGLHFAFMQMCADFLSLMALIYVTGGVESPFLYFFIFHVIIGSLLLPMKVISMLIAITVLTTFMGAMLEFQGVIAHFHIGSNMVTQHYSNELHIAVHFILLTVTLLISNYLANSISKELYIRERALTMAYSKLEEAETAKSKYVMSVVHDLKTPIAAAMTYLNILMDGSLGKVPEAFERPLERSRIRLNGAISVVNDILQLTQLKLAAKPVITDVNLTELVEEIYQEMRILFVSKHTRFSTWTNSDKDIIIEAERKLLKLALANLISNTHKYTDPNGRVEIHIKLIDDKVSIEIADDGIGIPETEQTRIFEDFYRSSLSKKSGIEGTGLGMSVVLHIIDQFNGDIRVESPSQIASGDDRPGTAFIILLPISYVSRSTEIEAATEKQ